MKVSTPVTATGPPFPPNAPTKSDCAREARALSQRIEKRNRDRNRDIGILLEPQEPPSWKTIVTGIRLSVRAPETRSYPHRRRVDPDSWTYLCSSGQSEIC